MAFTIDLPIELDQIVYQEAKLRRLSKKGLIEELLKRRYGLPTLVALPESFEPRVFAAPLVENRQPPASE
jgi:hypothetical protein